MSHWLSQTLIKTKIDDYSDFLKQMYVIKLFKKKLGEVNISYVFCYIIQNLKMAHKF